MVSWRLMSVVPGKERHCKDDHLTHWLDHLHSVPALQCRSQHCKHCHQTWKCFLLSPWWRWSHTVHCSINSHNNFTSETNLNKARLTCWRRGECAPPELPRPRTFSTPWYWRSFQFWAALLPPDRSLTSNVVVFFCRTFSYNILQLPNNYSELRRKSCMTRLQ